MFDVELGRIFLRMRNLLGVSLWDMARLVGGEPTVIANLEAGAIEALPPWPELARLVEAYAAHTGIDPQPILTRLWKLQPQPQHIATHTDDPTGRTLTIQPATFRPNSRPESPTQSHVWTNEVTLRPAAHTFTQSAPTATGRPPNTGSRKISNAPALAQAADIVEPTAVTTKHVRRAALSTSRGLLRLANRNVVGLLAFLVLPTLLLVSARFSPALLYAVPATLPAIIAAPLQSGIGMLVDSVAPVRDGLTWIEIDDPRIRKSDRLPERSR
jgi:hypothetical protein